MTDSLLGPKPCDCAALAFTSGKPPRPYWSVPTTCTCGSEQRVVHLDPPEMHAWWRAHPAYDALVASFRGSTRSPSHLAFLALTGLHSLGFDVVEVERG